MTTIDSVGTETTYEFAQRNEFADRASGLDWRWIWGGLFLACVPMLVPYLVGMWSLTHYQYFPFVFLAVGGLAYARSDRQFYPPRNLFGWAAIAVGVLFLLASVLVTSPWLGAIGFVCCGTAFVQSLKGLRDSSLLVLALPLAMLIRLPVGLDELLIMRLQRITTLLSSVVLDVLTIPHALAGNIIELASRDLFVAEACSGIQSVFTLAFLACLIIAYFRRRIWLAPIYLLAALGLAIAGNVFRVTTVAAADTWFSVDLAAGWQHDVLGYMSLGLATLFLLSFDQLVVTLLHPLDYDVHVQQSNPLLEPWNALVLNGRMVGRSDDYLPPLERPQANHDRAVSGDVAPGIIDQFFRRPIVRNGFLGCVGLLAIASVFQVGRYWVIEPSASVETIAFFSPPETLFEDSPASITLTDHEVAREGDNPRLGENADLWRFATKDVEGQIVLSQPYSGWHELCVCYQNMNWQLLDRSLVSGPQHDGASGIDNSKRFALGRFTDQRGGYGYLLFSAVHYDGEIAAAPSSLGALNARMLQRLDRRGKIDLQEMMMLQMWVAAPRKLGADELDQLEKGFLRVREQIAAAVQDANQSGKLASRLAQY